MYIFVCLMFSTCSNFSLGCCLETLSPSRWAIKAEVSNVLWNVGKVRGSSYWKWWWDGNMRISDAGWNLPHQPNAHIFAAILVRAPSVLDFDLNKHINSKWNLKLRTQKTTLFFQYIKETGNQSAPFVYIHLNDVLRQLQGHSKWTSHQHS